MLKSQGFCGPFPAPSFFAFKKNSISSGNENKNICCRDFFHEIQAYFDLYSTLPEHFGVWVGPKKHSHEIYGFLAVGKICTWK